MFYSKFLLSNKGSLSTVWVAAHSFRKLKKDQVQQTDISASVEKIIYDEVPIVAHRILAFLLLGVVRIYSKKVDYLFHDCQEILNKLCDFNIGKSARSGSRVTRRLNPTIIVPRSFELDAFDLEIVEDRDLRSGNNIPREQLMLTDGRREEGSTSGLPYMECRSMSFVIADSTASTTPPRDVLSLHNMDQDCFMIPFQSMKSSIASLEILRETGFLLEDRLGPMLLDEEEEEQLHLKPFNEHLAISHDMDHNDVSNASNNKGDTVPSLEIITGTGAWSRHCLDVMGLCNSEKEPLNNELFNDDMGVTGACSGQCLDVLVPDNSEKETFNNEPCSENIGVIIEGPIHHVDFGSNLEMPHESGYSDHCLGVRMLTETENGQPCDVSSDKELIIDEKQEDALDNSVNPRMLTETENGQACDVSSNKELIIDEDHVNHNARENLPRFVYNKRKVGAKKIKIPELITQESRNGKIIDVRPVSIDVTPDSKLAGVSVATPGFVTVQTPAPKERKKVFKKRKTLLDLIMVVSTNEYKEWINNTRDLIRKRRKVPHTHLDVWKARHTPPRLLEPSLPYVSIDLPSIQHEKETFVDLSSSEDEARTRVLEVDKVVITNEVEVQMPEPEGMRSPVCEQIPIAPGTPVTTHLNPLRLHEKFGSVAESDILKPTSSVETESMEKLPSPLEALELNAIFENEMNSPEGDSHETNIYSARTRMIGHYLHKSFLHIKRRERDETLNLSQLLAGRTKKESAMLFYEILVLKTRDCINVHQDSTYGDILLRQTSKLKPSLEFEHGLDVEC